MKSKEFLRDLMLQAWKFVKRNGVTIKEALLKAWLNEKLKLAMALRIVKFWFEKIDGTVREAYGTLSSKRIPEKETVTGSDNRKKNDTVQVYFDTEKQEWRCYKKMNLLRIS